MFSNIDKLQFATDSLFPIMLIINLIYGVIFWLLFRKDNLQSVTYWVRGCFCFALGAVLVIARDQLPSFSAWAAGVFLIAYAHFMCLKSLQATVDRPKANDRIVIIILILYGLGYFLIKNMDLYRTYSAWYIGTFSFALHGWIFFKMFGMRKLISNTFATLIAYCYLFSSLIWLLRVVLSQRYGFGESIDPGFINWFLLLLLTMNFIVKHSFFFGLMLEKKNNQLDKFNRLVSEKNDLLEQLGSEKTRAENANLAKSQFLANVSHEIRTPLHGLIGLLSSVIRSPMSEEIRKSLDKALYSSKTLLHVLNDILNFSKIDSGVVEVKTGPFSIKQLFDDVSDLFLVAATDKNIQLRFDLDSHIPEPLTGDFFKIRQVLFNLVGNSIKFTSHGFIEVKAHLEKINNQQASFTISVKDSGVGISAEYLEEIFEPFRQIDNSSSRHYEGVGLGLAIAQKILNLMDSKLVIKSQKDLGTEASFNLRLPISPQVPLGYLKLDANPQDSELKFLSQNSLSNLRLLVAEDNPINVEVIRQYLGFLKINAYFVADGQACIDELKRNQYDMVLMDLQMPNLGGIDATSQIRMIEGFKNLPIIGLSASIGEDDREKGVRSGMNDYLVKPFELDELAKIIMRHIKK
jgi:signal transduction histidine kinase